MTILILCLIYYKNFFIINYFLKNKYLNIFLGVCILIFNIYFFVLPENFVIGGLESNLIFLDKVFFYKKKQKKQKFFFSKNTNIIIIRILIILIFGYLLKDVPNFFISTVIINLFFAFVIKILEKLKIKRTFFIDRMPFFLKKNIFWKLFFLSLFLGINIGFSCGLIFVNNASTGGTDVIFSFIRYHFHLKKIKILLILTDGIMIVFSFFIDLKRQIDQKKNIILKYISSFAIFVIAIFVIDYILKK